MGILVNLLISGLAIAITAYILPGVTVDSFFTAIVVAVVLGLINAVIKPLITLLTLPINLLTLGLFSLVINALLIMMASAVVTGFSVDGFLWALIFSVVLSFVNAFLGMLGKK